MSFDINHIQQAVAFSLEEDVGAGDITAELLPADLQAQAEIITRESATLCGMAWVDEVYRQLDSDVRLEWCVRDGDVVKPNALLARLSGKARSIVTGERCALNWLQTLSGTATVTAQYMAKLKGSKTQLLDTRKTIPGLRYAQKYAVLTAGAKNHRMGLYDAYLIKENHIISCGSVKNAVNKAKTIYPDKKVEIEVEDLEELKLAIAAKADIIMLDNFTEALMREAVLINNGRSKLEVSGNITLESIEKIAATGVDYISSGALTKNLQAIDLSMRFLG